MGMVLDCVPVIPPDLRPMVQLDGGRFATSDLNDLYRRVINRNNRLKRLLDLGAPEIIVNNEKRMLQEAVDALFDNGRRGRPVTGPGNRPLKSLSDMLKGKQGRFRQNLLGKRVDYSGRSVIVVGPQLKLHQCGLPKEMAIELFKPFVMKRLVDLNHAQNIKSAKRMVERARPVVWDVLEEVITEHPVLLNRAPTLHRLGIQAFEPQLVEGKAIQIHPLVCTAFNADFDGDQMAVHLPLSAEAQAEARILMLSSNNILSPADGRPITSPTQDMVLGIFHLTAVREGAPGEGRAFASLAEAIMAYDSHTLIAAGADHRPARRLLGGRQRQERRRRGRRRRSWTPGDPVLVQTTLGRCLFNEALPEDYRFVNYEVTKKELGAIVNDLAERYPKVQVAATLDALKAAGFHWATRAGDHHRHRRRRHPAAKQEILDRYERDAEKIEKQYQRGVITDEERRQELIEIWTKATSEVAREMEANFPRTNPVWIMVNSGARGNMMQMRQIAGMRGLVANPKGEIIPRPIKANFREGLTVLEYFIATHGARKGLADTALRTADSGYLTRRLVDVSQDVIIREEDCGTERGVIMPVALTQPDGSLVKEAHVETGVYARVLAEDAVDQAGNVIVARGQDLGDVLIDQLVAAGITHVKVRCVLTCESTMGTCATCYGRSLATGKLVDVGEAVGIIAAQSIGEPGTQLTMRTFHTGGVAGEDITHGLPRVQELFEARIPKGVAPISEVEGRVRIEDGDRSRKLVVTPDDGSDEVSYTVSRRARLLVGEGDRVAVGQQLIVGSVEPARGAADHGPARGAAAPGPRGPGGLPLAGRVDPRQAHRGHHPADAQAGDADRLRLDRLPARPAGRAVAVRGGEPAGGGRGRRPGVRAAGAHGHHQGLARDRVVAVGGVLPGDDPGAHRRGHPGQVGRARRPQGERHHRQADPGRHRHLPVPQHPGGAHRGGPRAGLLDGRVRRVGLLRRHGLRPGLGPGGPAGGLRLRRPALPLVAAVCQAPEGPSPRPGGGPSALPAPPARMIPRPGGRPTVSVRRWAPPAVAGRGRGQTMAERSRDVPLVLLDVAIGTAATRARRASRAGGTSCRGSPHRSPGRRRGRPEPSPAGFRPCSTVRSGSAGRPSGPRTGRPSRAGSATSCRGWSRRCWIGWI